MHHAILLLESLPHNRCAPVLLLDLLLVHLLMYLWHWIHVHLRVVEIMGSGLNNSDLVLVE